MTAGLIWIAGIVFALAAVRLAEPPVVGDAKTAHPGGRPAYFVFLGLALACLGALLWRAT